MAKFHYLLLFLITFSLQLPAQKLALGKVTKEELLEKKHKKDTAAVAAVLFKKAKTDFIYKDEEGFESETVVQVKLKIYKKEGLEWANFKIPYYIGYENLEKEYVNIQGGYTYNLENDKIVKSKITGESKFKEKINENWEVKSVTFPNVRVGSIIELEYKFKSQNISVLPEFRYQYDIPLNYAEYKTLIPEVYIYTPIKKGFVNIAADQKLESTTQSFQSRADKVKVSSLLEYKQIVTTYTATDVPALKTEQYVNSMDNYYGEIDHELQMIRYADKDPKQIATTWEAVAKSIFDDKDFNDAINQFDYFTTAVKPLVSGVDSAEQKTQLILNFVKKNMNWNGKYGYYPRNKMDEAFKNKVGNVAEINLMMISMLRMSGINANPVLVSTRDNGIALFPNRTLFNYVIAAAEIDGQTILLDATSKNSDFNILPIRDLNLSGRLIRKDGSSAEINLMPKSNSNDTLTLMATIEGNGDVWGKIRDQYSDYNAFLFREKYNGIAKESYVEKLMKDHQGLEIGTYEARNTNDLSKPISEEYEFKSTNSVEIIGAKMYVSPLLFFALTENPFKQETRQYPVDFAFPNQERYNISLTIPEGYVVEALPQPKALAMPDNIASFKYNISVLGNKLQLLFVHDTNQAVIGAEYYDVLKNFYKEMVNKQTEKIVLKKA